MRRRTRVDLGQEPPPKEEVVLNRKRQRWAERNKDRPAEENPFIRAIRPDQIQYGDPKEKGNELRNRLNNLEFGNFPGYFNYRNKAAQESKSAATKATEHDGGDNNHCKDNDSEQSVIATESDGHQSKATGNPNATTPIEQPLEAGLSDERLAFFKKNWFEGKNVLDIGCNRGHITYAIARLFSPMSIIGIDIDLKMINMANRDLHLHLEDGLVKEADESRLKRAAQLRLDNDNTTCYTEQANHFPISNYISHGPLSVHCQRSSDTPACSDVDKNFKDEPEDYKFPNNILFVEHNYVLSKDELVDKQEAHFDTIVCLSVTKWIHLNYCDAGLKRFFRRIYKHLKPGGLLVLEAQPFDNYGRRKKLSDRLKANYYSIQFKPDKFDEYLLSEEVGFKQIIEASVTKHECVGFKRPLKVFLK